MTANVAPALRGMKSSAYYMLFLLALVSLLNALDKLILSIVMEPIKLEFALSDSQMGLIAGLALAIFNAAAMVPIGRLADRVNRCNLIATCLGIWSVATALGGLATNWIQLLLSRMVVGIGEAGGGPPSLSMLSDTFPAERRATVLSILAMTTAIGGMLALVLGGWIASHYGWRVTLIATGVPGLALSILIILTLKEPLRGQLDQVDCSAAPQADLKRTLSYIWTCVSLRHIVFGIILVSFVFSATVAWAPAYLVRTHKLSLEHIGFMLGAANLVALAGPPLGGLLADRLARRDQRWWCWLVAISVVMAGIFLAGFVSAPTPGVALGFFTAYALVITIWYGPSYGMVQTLVAPQMRATMTAACYMAGNIFGFGLGTQSMGLLSDLLNPVAGQDSLRYAMVMPVIVAGWAAFHFVRAARSLRHDLATVQDRQ